MDTKKNDAIIRLFHVSKRYGSKIVLNDLTLDIIKNNFIVVTGPTGCGKSTLLKLLYRFEQVSEGQINVDGLNLSVLPQKKLPILRRKFGIIFQNFQLLERHTVFDNIALVLEIHSLSNYEIKKRVNHILKIVELETQANSLPINMSESDKQLLSIARALVSRPKIILADEPTGQLDSHTAEKIIELLKKYHLKGTTIILATHRKNLIQQNNIQVVQLNQGILRPSIH